MAITTKEELAARALQLVPKDTASWNIEKVSKIIWQEMKDGGTDQMSNVEFAKTLREAYNEPFWTERYVAELKERFNLS